MHRVQGDGMCNRQLKGRQRKGGSGRVTGAKIASS